MERAISGGREQINSSRGEASWPWESAPPITFLSLRQWGCRTSILGEEPHVHVPPLRKRVSHWDPQALRQPLAGHRDEQVHRDLPGVAVPRLRRPYSACQEGVCEPHGDAFGRCHCLGLLVRQNPLPCLVSQVSAIAGLQIAEIWEAKQVLNAGSALFRHLPQNRDITMIGTGDGSCVLYKSVSGPPPSPLQPSVCSSLSLPNSRATLSGPSPIPIMSLWNRPPSSHCL